MTLPISLPHWKLTLLPCPELQADLDADASDPDNDDDLFEPRKRNSGAGADGSNPDALDAPDSSRVAIDDSLLTKWDEPGQAEQLRNRFVTGGPFCFGSLIVTLTTDPHLKSVNPR